MLDNPLAYIPAVAGTIAAFTAAGGLVARVSKARREAAHRRWTAQQEAHIQVGGPRFKLQVLRKDREALEWAVSQGRLRVAKDMPWGWYVVVETRLTTRTS